MKKFLVLMAALALVFAFVACGDDDDPVKPPSSSSSVASSVGSSNSTSSSTSSAAATTYTVNGKTYTTAPYGFTGNIKSVRDAITGTVTFASPIANVSGVVTAIDYSSSTTALYFWMQDDEAGIYVRTTTAQLTGGTPTLGALATLTATGGQIFNDLKQLSGVTGLSFDTSALVTQLKVKTGDVAGTTTRTAESEAAEGQLYYLPSVGVTNYASMNIYVQGWDYANKLVRGQNPALKVDGARTAAIDGWDTLSADFTPGTAAAPKFFKLVGIPALSYGKLQVYMYHSGDTQGGDENAFKRWEALP